jgi:DNA-3-methyladenine glycosylase I
MNYCEFCLGKTEDNPHRIYHDERYGFPVIDDEELFGRLILEINQAGLSWDTILKKEKSFRSAYQNFKVSVIAKFDLEDEKRLMTEPGIIRNRAKIKAVIYNAQRVLDITEEYGSFSKWLDHHHPKSLDEWNKLFKKTFKFVGLNIVREFLMSIGYLSGAHDDKCPVYQRIKVLLPKWME